MWIKIAVQEVGPITLVAFRALFGLLFGIVVVSIPTRRLAAYVQGMVPASPGRTHERGYPVLSHLVGRTVH